MPESPYSTKFASGEIDHDHDPRTQMRAWKAEEKETHYGPNVLPYEMAEIPEYYGNMVDNGIQACKAIEVALKTKEFKNKQQLLKLKKNTEKMVVYLLQNVDSTLEKYTIGARHLGDRDLDFEEMD
jgi:hypothetical protein